MVDDQVIQLLSEEFSLTDPATGNFSIRLAQAINYLIENDFSRLVQILYRMDVSESKLRHMLTSEVGEDAGMIIGKLVLEREQQKLNSRKGFKKNNNIPDEEAW